MTKKHFAAFVFLLFLGVQAFSYGVLAHPRKVFILSTNHFDILFSNEDKILAKYLADNADIFYDKANAELNAASEIRIPIIISPDSDAFSVSFTTYPYYRMLIFDAVPDAEFADYKTTFDNLFYHEVFSAIAQSMMSPFNKTVKKIIGGDSYNPISLINLPFSFVQGFTFVNNQDLEVTKFNDKYYLKLLSQAKLENKFPTRFQSFAARDIYPENELPIAAGSAFAAYLINTFGIEKYAEFWEECGKLHFYFTAGIFKKVYNQSIDDVWKDFIDSIPLPDELAELNELENEIECLFQNSENNYAHILSSKYGLIWYDSIRHEIDVFDFNEKNKRKKLLFADGVTSLDISPDNKYLAISYSEKGSSDNFIKQKAWIYDIEDEKIKNELSISNVAFLQFSDESLGVVGIAKKDNKEKIQIYDLDFENDENNNLYSEIELPNENLVSSIVPLGKGIILYNYFEKNEGYLCKYNYIEKSSEHYRIENGDNQIRINNFRLQPLNGENVITFEYNIENDNSFNRIGYFTPDFQKVFLQCNDVSGGINYPVLANEKLYFSANKFEHDELEVISLEKIRFNEANIFQVKTDVPHQEMQSIFSNEVPDIDQKELQFCDYKVKKYNPLLYLKNISTIPLMTVSDISSDEVPSMYPGLGLTLKTQPDIFNNNQFLLSASWKNFKWGYTWTNNIPEEREKDIKQENIEKEKDKSVVFFYHNTSTPIDIKTGATFHCNLDGEYDFKAILGTNWQLPLGMSFVKLNFKVDGYYSVSTDYYDSNLIEKYHPLSGWPSFFDAYDLFFASATVNFTNIHQYGVSKFQNYGISFGVTLYSLWDLYEIELLRKAEKENGSEEELTNAQKQNLRNSSALQITQLSLGLFAALSLPVIVPVRMHNGWVFSLPTTIDIEILNEAGTVMSGNIETLLIGREFNKGISGLNLFFNRFGIKAGYNYNFNYDTTTVKLPDIRNISSLWDALSNSFYRDSIYVQIDLDTTIPIGALSDKIINSQLKANYYPDTKGFTISLLFDVKF